MARRSTIDVYPLRCPSDCLSDNVSYVLSYVAFDTDFFPIYACQGRL